MPHFGHSKPVILCPRKAVFLPRLPNFVLKHLAVYLSSRNGHWGNGKKTDGKEKQNQEEKLELLVIMYKFSSSSTVVVKKIEQAGDPRD